MEGSGDGNNHGLRFIIVECYVSNEKSRPLYTMPSKLFSPFLAFACVGEVDGDADFAMWKCSIDCKVGASRKKGSFEEGRPATIIKRCQIILTVETYRKLNGKLQGLKKPLINYRD